MHLPLLMSEGMWTTVYFVWVGPAHRLLGRKVLTQRLPTVGLMDTHATDNKSTDALDCKKQSMDTVVPKNGTMDTKVASKQSLMTMVAKMRCVDTSGVQKHLMDTKLEKPEY